MKKSEHFAITSGWAETNHRRGLLILGEAEGVLTPEEATELDELQRLADLRTDLLAPFSKTGLS